MLARSPTQATDASEFKANRRRRSVQVVLFAESSLRGCRRSFGPAPLALHDRATPRWERRVQPDDLLEFVETVDRFGEQPSLLEQEQRPDGSTRYLLHLALAPPGPAARVGGADRRTRAPAPAAPAPGRRPQRGRTDGPVARAPGALVANPFAEARAHQVGSQYTRNGHHIDGWL
jgi:hypothetical protein